MKYVDMSWWGHWLNDEWAQRWILFLVIPLAIGFVFGSAAIRVKKSGSSWRAPTTDPQGDWVKKLTFLGVAVTTGAAFIGSPSADLEEDLGILLASNVFFAALASTHPLLLALDNEPTRIPWTKRGWTNRVAAAAVLCSAVASLTSIAVLVWRSEIVPYPMQWFLTGMSLAAAVLVSWYVTERVSTLDNEPCNQGRQSKTGVVSDHSEDHHPDVTSQAPRSDINLAASIRNRIIQDKE